MKFELHCHSMYSRGKKIPAEGIDSPRDLVRTAKKIGLDGLALTDHYSDRGWTEAKEEARKQGLIFIPGIEVSSKEGHIIGLGLNGYVQSGLPVEETLESIREQGAVSVAAHPFDIRNEGIKEKCLKADATEVFNSMNLDRFSNLAARRFARKNRLVMLAGSDSHTKEMLGQCINHIEASDVDSCLKEIRKGRVSFSARYTPLERLLPWIKMRLSLSYGDIVRYADSRYQEPKRWISKRLLHRFVSARREYFWYWLGEAGLRGSVVYGGVKYFSRSCQSI
jgi:predicted metal-dependent phosphoesterase TrpH